MDVDASDKTPLSDNNLYYILDKNHNTSTSTNLTMFTNELQKAILLQRNKDVIKSKLLVLCQNMFNYNRK